MATLVTPRWAITAAHCTESRKLTTALAAGGYAVDVAGRRRTLDRLVRHGADLPRYSRLSASIGSSWAARHAG